MDEEAWGDMCRSEEVEEVDRDTCKGGGERMCMYDAYVDTSELER